MEMIFMRYQYRFFVKLLGIFPSTKLLSSSLSSNFQNVRNDFTVTEEYVPQKQYTETVSNVNDKETLIVTDTVNDEISCEIHAQRSNIVTYVITDDFDTVLQVGLFDMKNVDNDLTKIHLDGWKYDNGSSYKLTYEFHDKTDDDVLLSATRSRNRRSDNKLEFTKV